MPARHPVRHARAALVALLCLAVATFAACSSSQARLQATPAPTSSSRPLPPPVSISPEPQGIGLRDPSFDALPGAKADYGHLGGTVYEIEMPDNWNGRLFLYQHGFQSPATQASVDQPPLRNYLIEHGWAWGASSFSSTSLIPGRAADETAALWDYFVGKYGRPQYTYIAGDSMGGAATNIAAERYGDRYDGALSTCGYAGQSAQTDIVDDYFFAGAHLAGVTQGEFDAATDYTAMINQRIIPALKDPAKQQEFHDILNGITGGPRAFDALGFDLEEASNWTRASILVAARVGGNVGRVYDLGPTSSVSSADFNRGVIRMTADPTRKASFEAGNELTGDITMPVLTLHTTGDWQVPIDQERILRQKVDAAGRGDSLVQRVIQAPEHCGFTEPEQEQALQDLVAWVEHGTKPAGDDVTADLANSGSRFTLAPRFGSDGSSAAPGASDRVTVSGDATIDGQPLSSGAFIWVDVLDNGLIGTCTFPGEPVSDGRYTRVVAAASEVLGCGGPGAEVRAVTFAKGRLVYSDAIAWPAAGGHDLNLDVSFNTDAGPDPRLTPISGSVTDATGARLPPATVIEAYAGSTLCGATSLPPVVMLFNRPDVYQMWVVGPDSVPGCVQDAALTFKVNGKPADGSATNALTTSPQRLDLVAH